MKTYPEGQAFPTSEMEGMTVREYFAASCLAGIIASRPPTANPFVAVQAHASNLARAAVLAADALIEELNAKTTARITGREEDGEA